MMIEIRYISSERGIQEIKIHFYLPSPTYEHDKKGMIIGKKTDYPQSNLIALIKLRDKIDKMIKKMCTDTDSIYVNMGKIELTKEELDRSCIKCVYEKGTDCGHSPKCPDLKHEHFAPKEVDI